jgi:pimeloyl-ACP methyl ester carboxylesterase
MANQVRSLRVATGVTLDVLEQRRHGGVPVIFLHGFADSRRSFDLVLPHLPAWIGAVAPSFRGHGESSVPPAGYAITDLAADVVALIEARALAPAVLVGHSLGSAVALRIAIDRPDRVRGIVLAGATPSISASPAARAFWDEQLARLADPVDFAFLRSMAEGMVARPVPSSFIELMATESAKVPAHVWRAFLESRWRGEGEYAGELGRVAAPALIVWGDRDPRYRRADQDALVAGIADARLVVYEGAGHALHWEEPARFASDVAAFVADTADHP